MKEYQIWVRDWISNKSDTFNVFADSEEEAREVAREMVGSKWEIVDVRRVRK